MIVCACVAAWSGLGAGCLDVCDGPDAVDGTFKLRTQSDVDDFEGSSGSVRFSASRVEQLGGKAG